MAPALPGRLTSAVRGSPGAQRIPYRDLVLRAPSSRARGSLSDRLPGAWAGFARRKRRTIRTVLRVATSNRRAAAAERAVRDRRQAKKLITAARAAARQWGDVPLATDTVVSVAESISARPGTPTAQRAVLEQINWETVPLVGRSTEAAGLSGRCQGEKDAAADRRHQQALSEWSALPRRRRWLTRRPERERPGLPSPEEVAVARGELVGVVRSAMITELEKVVPRPRPASPPADGARTPPVADAARRDRLQVGRPAEGRRQAPVRTPDTRPEPAQSASPPRRPAPRDRGQEPGR